MTLCVLGAMVTIGWFTGLDSLTRLAPSFASMKLNTAVGLGLVGLSIVSLSRPERTALRIIGLLATAAYALIGTASLLEYRTGRSFGIDDPFGLDTSTVFAGRIAESTAFCFIAMAISVGAIGRRHLRLGQLAGLVVVVVGLLAVVGYGFGVASLYRVGPYSSMAVHTALAFVIGGLAVLLVRPDTGWVALVTEDTAGGMTVRRMLVPAVVGPAAIGAAINTAFLASPFRMALFTVSTIVLTTVLVWNIGAGLRHVDLRRVDAEDALKRVNVALDERNHAVAMLSDAMATVRSNEERFRASVEHLNESLMVFTSLRDEAGTIVDFSWDFANEAASLMTGFAGSELVGRTMLGTLPEASGMVALYAEVVETGKPYVDPSLWYEDVWGDGIRSRRAFDVRATKLGDGMVIVSREVTHQIEHESALEDQRIDLQRANVEMSLLNGLADMLQGCATADEAYSVVTQSCAGLFSTSSGAISVMHPSRDVLDVEGSWGTAAEAESFAPTDCWALRRGRPFVSGATGPRWAHLGRSNTHRLCVPMVAPGENLGVLHVRSSVVDANVADDGLVLQLAITVAAQLSMAFANLRLRDSLREMSIRDPLTGLFNRRYMEESFDRELARAERDGADVSILVIDVDRFKAFNDTYGHDAGDAVLGAVGELLEASARTSDIACRFGGEEFVMILPGCSLETARRRADELRRDIASLRIPFQHIELSGPTISCGIAAFREHGATRGEIFRAADGALYVAKNGGRNQIVIAPIPARV